MTFCRNKLLWQFKMESIQALHTLGNAKLLATERYKLVSLTTDLEEYRLQIVFYLFYSFFFSLI